MIHMFPPLGVYGIKLGPLWLVVKNRRRAPEGKDERNQHGCRHITIGRWRWLVSWRTPTEPQLDAEAWAKMRGEPNE